MVSAASRRVRVPDAEDDAYQAVLDTVRALVIRVSHSLARDDGEVTLTQLRALAVLAERGPQRSVDLANAIGIDASTASRVCTRLAHRGFVAVRRSHESRRELRIALTAEGQSVLDAVGAEHLKSIHAVLDDLDPASRAFAAATFRRIAQALSVEDGAEA